MVHKAKCSKTLSKYAGHLARLHISLLELLELGESVGTQNRGLSQELVSLLPVSKYKCSLFSRKKSRNERCNTKEMRDGLPCLANISTMLDVAPNGLASISALQRERKRNTGDEWPRESAANQLFCRRRATQLSSKRFLMLLVWD
ncbi:hypothetical protein V6N13_002177 [Hibiscus sabdariffa]|uniref:Uncharacterized protein n=1 Tax=Hibiscus sabdariffa TaxID=183260 RepID=A0ABR2C234_9ROSI